MPWTQQQFDFVAAALGPEKAAEGARAAGGVSPSQGQVAPTQITGAQFDGGRLTAGSLRPGAGTTTLPPVDVPQNVFADFVEQPPAGLTDREKIIAAERLFRANLGAGLYAGMTQAQAISDYSVLLQQQGISVPAADGRARDQVPGWLRASGQTGVDWGRQTGTQRDVPTLGDAKPEDRGQAQVTAQPGTPTGAELTAILQGIVNDWQNGVFAGDTTKVVQAIADALAISYTEASQYYPLIQPDLTGTGLGQAGATGATTGATTGAVTPGAGVRVPVPTAQIVMPPVGDPVAREAYFEAQEPEEMYERVLGQQYGPLTPLAREALRGQWKRFLTLDPITGFAARFPGGPEYDPTMVDRGNRFAAFLRGERPTYESLSQQLNAIIGGNVPGNLAGQMAFQGAFPSPETAYSAAVQPFLQGMGPILGESTAGALSRDFARRLYQAPEAFQDPSQIADIFEQYRQGGFLPDMPNGGIPTP